MTEKEAAYAEYVRIGRKSDEAFRELIRRDRAHAIGRALNVTPYVLRVLSTLARRAEVKYWRLADRRHAAFDVWNKARKAANSERG
jgi:hypothetical protein